MVQGKCCAFLICIEAESLVITLVVSAAGLQGVAH